MRYLGIDYGARRVGLAVSAEDIAFPRETLDNGPRLFAELLDLVRKEKIDSIVVGDTRSFGGRANPVTRDAEAFIERLKKETGLPVAPAFEAGSSVEASRYDPKGEGNDAAAAAIILQRFLDMKGTVQ